MKNNKNARIQFCSYTLGLITGSNRKVKTADGIKEEFVPAIENKHLPLPLILKMNGKVQPSELFIAEGLHPKLLNIDYSVFKKDDQERKNLKEIKSKARFENRLIAVIHG